MSHRKTFHLLFSLMAIASLLFGGRAQARGIDETRPNDKTGPYHYLDNRVNPLDRREAAKNATQKGLAPGLAGVKSASASAPSAIDVPHYFGPFANYANSPLPTGAVADIVVDLPGSGYSAPVVTITDVYGTGSGATADAVLDLQGGIAKIVITNGGAGYSAPWVLIDDPTGSGAAASASIGGALSGGIRKFVDSLPGLNVEGANNLGQYMPVAIPDTTTFPGSDYYEIELVEFTEQLHSDLPATTLRGYRQTNTTDPSVSQAHYLGPLIIAQRDTPVRIKFTNSLPSGAGGNLFLPVDKTVMGAGMGPLDMPGMPGMKEEYTENRATLHLHGGFVPWISDGTPHQWTTPAGETTQYPKGVSVQYVPDMWYDASGNVIPNTVGQTTPPVAGASNNPGDGALTFYYNNQQSARLQFYHDHAYGITRLNVYAGEAAGYLVTDGIEQDLINGTNNSGVNPGLVKALPGVGIPLIIQDKTFVDAATIAAQDPNWRWGTGPVIDPATGARAPRTGDLWLPSVYMPAQNPWDPTGASAFGRWMYGPWFWPPTKDITSGPVPNEYYDPGCDPAAAWCEPPLRPSVPDPSMGMEAFMDTAMVNGTAYPYMEVDPTLVRFRILNAADDRFFNLQFYVADPDVTTSDGRTNTEVKMVPATATPGFPADWPTDGRAGGVPDPAMAGPSWIQIGTEGGFLPSPVVIPPQPIAWNGNPTAFNFGNVTTHSLLLGCAERADVLVDFSQYAGQTLILYNDAPAAFPALDPRYDYYTGDPAQMDSGGAPSTQPGFGPNTRTIMQIRVKGSPAGQPLAGVKVTHGGSDYASVPEVAFTGGGGTGASAVATGRLDHVTVVNPGFNYTSAPSVAVDSVAGQGASANATVSVSALVLGDPGAGYASAPSVSITDSGSGSGATASATVSVAAIALTDPGAGYSAAPSVSITDSGTGAGATASATVSVAAIALVDPGAGYTAPVVTIADAAGSGSGATASATFDPVTGAITGLSLDTPGAGYTAPVATITDNGGPGSGAAASLSGVVDSLALLTPGAGYTAPAVSFSGGAPAAPAAASTTGVVDALALLTPGAGYTAPAVGFSGGAPATPAAASTTGVVDSLSVVAPGSNYVSAPSVAFSGGSGSGAAADAAVAGGQVAGFTITNPGSGYASAPTVILNSAGSGSGAAVRAVINGGRITGFIVDNPGSGYLAAPKITISGGNGSLATGVAALSVDQVELTDPGSGYTSLPRVSFLGGSGYDAAAYAYFQKGPGYDLAPLNELFTSTAGHPSVFAASQDRIIVPQAAYDSAYNETFPGDMRQYVQIDATSITFFNGPLPGLTLTNGGSGYLTAPEVAITGGGGSGATAVSTLGPGAVGGLTLANGGSNYLTAPTVTISGGGGSGARATAALAPRPLASISVTNGGSSYTSAPTVTITGGGGSGAAAVAVIGTNRRVTAVTVTNPGSGYTSAPTVAFTGGGGSGAAAAAVLARAPVGSLTLTSGGSGYTTAPSVAFSGGGGSGATATAALGPRPVASLTLTNPGTGFVMAPTVTISGGGGSGAAAIARGTNIPFEPKAIHDEMGAAYDTTYGRMGGLLGLELPGTNNLVQNVLLSGYASPPVDILRDSMTPLGTLADGTQIWQITHNGVDTHPIHFHLVNVQLINRVAWDGALLPPDPNELGWKETVRVNPLEQTIVAMRPVAPTQPFDLPNSIRPIDPTMPLGEVLETPPGGFMDPGGNPVQPVINTLVNFGWEYVYHCHILSHEEMDMMHAVAFAVAPKAPSNLTAAYFNSGPRRVDLTWTDNAINETGFVVERATNPAGPWQALTAIAPAGAGVGATISYRDPSAQNNRTYYYRVSAINVVGDTSQFAAPAIGFPTEIMSSAPTNPGVSIATSSTGGAGVPFIFASSFADGLAGWAGSVGNVQVIAQAAMGPAGAPLGMAAAIGNLAGAQPASLDAAQAAYVYDASPDNETVYSAGFYFNPDGARTGDGPVDIFSGLDSNSQPVFGLQYEADDAGSASGEVRAWVLQNGQPVYTAWADIESIPHSLQVAWQSGATAGFSLVVDGNLVQTLTGDTSAHLLDEVRLGPSNGLTTGASGTMYFDEFVSSRSLGVQYNMYLPSIAAGSAP